MDSLAAIEAMMDENIIKPATMKKFQGATELLLSLYPTYTLYLCNPMIAVVDTMCSDVAMLRIYPSIMASTVRHFLKLPIRGVVLQCYGAGNIPSNREDILEAIRDGANSGVIILVVTQCPHGGVRQASTYLLSSNCLI